jgi:DNA-binding transcriptional regulator YhcF (GntR family)
MVEFGIHFGRRMQPLDPQPVLIDRADGQLVEAIADGTLAPGQRVRHEELGRSLGVSRQPISHALQLLKQQKLVEENGRRRLIVSEIDAARIRELYQVRSALDSLAARLAASALPAGRSTCGSGGPPSGHSLRGTSFTRMPPYWRSSEPMSLFISRSIVCRATARSKTPSPRNGRI